jgi:hypothetical protein
LVFAVRSCFNTKVNPGFEASKRYHPGPPSGHPHLMDHQNFNFPIQTPNFQVHRIQPRTWILANLYQCCIAVFMKF